MLDKITFPQVLITPIFKDNGQLYSHEKIYRSKNTASYVLKENVRIVRCYCAELFARQLLDRKVYQKC